MADELAVRSLVVRYADAVIRSHLADWRDCWCEDATWQIGSMRVEGRDAIAERWQMLMGLFANVFQIPQLGQVRLEGDTGRGRWYVSEYGQAAAGREPSFTFGVYHDVYRRTPGGWRFAARRFDALYTGAADFSGRILPFPDDADF